MKIKKESYPTPQKKKELKVYFGILSPDENQSGIY